MSSTIAHFVAKMSILLNRLFPESAYMYSVYMQSYMAVIGMLCCKYKCVRFLLVMGQSHRLGDYTQPWRSETILDIFKKPAVRQDQ